MTPISAIIIVSLAAGMSIATTAAPVKAASPDGSFTLAQTNGMERRQDRRDTRQDCRSEGGLVGADKRNCKQEGRSDDDKPADATKPADNTAK